MILRLCRVSLTLAAVFPVLLQQGHAELRLPNTISDHAVLQRESPIHIWGWAGPNEPITVSLHDQKKTAKANNYGEWGLWLDPEAAGGPYTLTVASVASASQPLTREDILVGDVWVASGQSNMEMPLRGFPGSAVLKDAAKEIASANQPKMRLLRLEKAFSDVPQEDIAATWTACTPETATEFSAVAYLFGREIQQKQNVPVGLIDTTWGGTPISSWVSLDALGADASLMPVFATRARFADEQAGLPRVEAEEKREDAAAAQAHQPAPSHPWHPMQESWLPAALYNGMIAPLTPYSIKGFLWYQGETDSAPERAPLYAKMLQTLIADWRGQWRQGNLPFLYVQISSFHSPAENWGVVRDAERRSLVIGNTAMAVSIDVGEAGNVHPADKQTVASRLALAAEGLVYHEKVEYSGPLYRQTTVEDGSLRVWFDHAAGLRTTPFVPLASVTASTLQSSFEIAGDDRRFVPAHAVIEGETVVVSSSSVPHPRYVRYAWANESVGGLYNKSGLPASTFTSE